MAKIKYDGITFDSELEANYYAYLQAAQRNGEVLDFYYHPDQISNLVGKRSYTPDFLVAYDDRIEIIETKGYNPYSKMIDDQIHNIMLSKNEYFLKSYVTNVISKNIIRLCGNCWNIDKKVIYRKIKYLKAYGFVDWDFKNPNTIANKRKEKITDLTEEVKELKEFKKNMLRYLAYHKKIIENQKLTKSQKEWYYNYVNEINKILEENK